MAYVAPADFRSDTLKYWCQGLELREGQADDTILTAAIASASLRLDEYVEDHFEPEDAATVYVDGRWRQQLILPKRVRTVTSVTFKDPAGAYTISVPSTSYSIVSSVSGSSVNTSQVDLLQAIQSLPGSVGCYWPGGTAMVRVVGNLSWPTGSCPDDVKRAVALLVYDEVAASDPALGRADRMVTPGRTIDYGGTAPTGIRYVDEVIGRYHRPLAAAGALV